MPAMPVPREECRNRVISALLLIALSDSRTRAQEAGDQVGESPASTTEADRYLHGCRWSRVVN